MKGPCVDTKSLCKVGEIAEVLMLSERRIHQLVRQGIIPKAKRGRYELASAVQGYICYLESRNPAIAPSVGEEVFDYRRERARLTKAQADRAEAETAKITGEVVSVRQVERNLATLFAEVAANMRNIPTRVASALVGNTDEREVKTVLLREIDSVLTALADSDILIEPSDDEEDADSGEI